MSRGLSAIHVAEAYIRNDSPFTQANDTNKQSWTWAGKISQQIKTSVSTTEQDTYGLSVAVEVGASVEIPLVAKMDFKVTTTGKYEYSRAETRLEENSETTEFSWNQGTTQQQSLLSPGEAVHCTCTAWMGVFESGYTATVKMIIGGRDYIVKRRGKVETTSYSNSISGCKKMLIEDIPDGSNVINAPDTIKNDPEEEEEEFERKRAVKFTA